MITEVLSAISHTRNGQQSNLHQEFSGKTIIETDPALLRVVLRNLLENAIEYTPPQGCIDIRTEHDPAGQLLIKISNSCVGLNASDLPRLFEPFWRADASRTGTGHAGLGLTLVQAYCQAIGASVDVALVSRATIQFTVRFALELNRGR